jgi:D-alanyl-D-alanine carboxypeptidase (penicillin-binding protein 5/6)
MNSTAMRLHLKTTKYTNPHGLSDKANHSTANELAQLSSFAMKNAVIRKIVSCKVI